MDENSGKFGENHCFLLRGLLLLNFLLFSNLSGPYTYFDNIFEQLNSDEEFEDFNCAQ